MDTMKQLLRAVFFRYCIVFSLVMGVNIVGMAFVQKADKAIAYEDLLLIVVMAALCALGELFFILPGEVSRRKEIILYICHYVYINVVVFSVILWKYYIKIEYAIVTAVSIAVIYWINVMTDFYQNKKDALKMNDLLEKINNNDE